MRKIIAATSILILSAPAAAAEPWEALAECESNNRNVNTGNGYYGYYQFDRQTWESTGRSGLPSDYSRAEQTAAAADLYAMRGGEPWPSCWPGGSPGASVKSNPAPEPAVRRYAPPARPTQSEHLSLTG